VEVPVSSLAHKTVVILGGTSGIGLATAKAAQAEGARVIVTGQSRDRLQAAQSERGSGARSVALDVADEGGTRALFQELDRIDHIFITAGSVALMRGLLPTVRRCDPRWTSVFGARLMPPSTAPPK
jgi:NAD(P)-dependent dehydrogenase (short-subunit alcohol dehydrogenase family)